MENRLRRARGSGSVFQRASDGMWVGRIDATTARGEPRRRLTFYGLTREAAEGKLDEWLAENRPDAPAPDAPRSGRSRLRHLAAARAIATHTEKEWRAKCIAADHLCYYCGRHAGISGGHKDHIMPISRGGSDGIDNLALACWDCNTAKADMLPDEFIAWAERSGFFAAPRTVETMMRGRFVRLTPLEWEIHKRALDAAHPRPKRRKVDQ